jgi:crossover junction endodeoxyribonuclease RuvC
MRYLGIDPGTSIIGYGVIEEAGGAVRPVEWGVIRNSAASPTDKQATAAAVRRLADAWKPDAAGVERLFFMNNKRSAMAVAEMRGVILLALADHGIVVHEFTPLQVKQHVCGHGGAPKAQVQRMVRMLLRIQEEIRPDDAADALALALCCWTVHRQR